MISSLDKNDRLPNLKYGVYVRWRDSRPTSKLFERLVTRHGR